MNRFWGFLLLLLSVSSFAQRGGEVVNTDDTINTSYALVVGISNYLNIKPLMYADDDADAFATWLIEQEICTRNNVKRLIDSQATAANFYLELERFLTKAKANDRLYIYFAGHGDVENKIQAGFLLCYGTRPSPYAGSDVIDINMLENYVNAFTNNKTKVVLITDACRAGNLAGGLAGVSNTLTAINNRFHNVIKMLSCQPNQLSQEKLYPGGGHGVFTYHLLNGLYGLADRDGDRKISLRELDIYLDEVTNETEQKQSPKVDGNPMVKLVGYNETLKQLAIAKKSNASTVKGRTNDRARNDTGWKENKYYQKFRQAIQEQILVDYMPGSAEFIIRTAEFENQPADMIADMKLELAAVLEDQLQKWVNIYLRGELDPEKNNCFDCIVQMSLYADYLDRLTPKDHLRYKEVHAKKLFFDVYQKWAYRKKSEYPSYIKQLKEADQLVPNQAWLHLTIGSLYGELVENELAILHYDKAISLAPKWSYAFIDRGIIYLNQGKYDLAEADFKTAAKLDPGSTAAIYNLGLTYEDQNRYGKSDSCYKQALVIDSLYSSAWSALADNAIDSGSLVDAEYYLNKALLTDSMEYSVYRSFGRLYEKQKNYLKAQEYFEKAVAVNDYSTYALNSLGAFFYRRNMFADALQTFMLSYQKDSLKATTLLHLGRTYKKLENSDKAEYWYRKSLTLHPRSEAAWGAMGELYIEKKKFTEAEKFLRKALSLDPTYAWVWMKLGHSKQLQKKYEEAKKLYYKTIEVFKPSYYALFHLSEIFIIENQLDSAIANVMLSVQYGPEYEEASKLADSLLLKQKDLAMKMAKEKLQKKDFESAEVYFTRLQKLYAGDPEVLYSLASTLAGAGKKERALETLRQAVANGFADLNRLKADRNFEKVAEVEAIRNSLEK